MPQRSGVDDGGAGGTGAATSGEPGAAAGAGDPGKSGGLLRQGDDPMSPVRFIAVEQARIRSSAVSRARGLAERILCLEHAAAVGTRGGQRGADRPDPGGARAQPRHLQGTTRPRRAAGSGDGCRAQAGCAVDARGPGWSAVGRGGSAARRSPTRRPKPLTWCSGAFVRATWTRPGRGHHRCSDRPGLAVPGGHPRRPAPAGWSAGRWPITCAPSWRWTPSPWRWPDAVLLPA